MTFENLTVWRCEECDRLWNEDSPPGQVHDHRTETRRCEGHVHLLRYALETEWYALNPEHDREARFQDALDELCAELEAEKLAEDDAA